ncbi:MAG: type II toxin-antitoxin system prevent-host-death family antitoxin [Verrucomicrobiota bacterium]
MKSPLLTLRRSLSKILNAIENRQEVTLTKRGKPLARIFPMLGASAGAVRSQPAFGMWSDTSVGSVDEQIREFRFVREMNFRILPIDENISHRACVGEGIIVVLTDDNMIAEADACLVVFPERRKRMPRPCLYRRSSGVKVASSGLCVGRPWTKITSYLFSAVGARTRFT